MSHAIKLRGKKHYLQFVQNKIFWQRHPRYISKICLFTKVGLKEGLLDAEVKRVFTL